jgi:hypothetical protein
MHHMEAIWDRQVGSKGEVHWFYIGAMRATFGSTVAKERRCGACRRLVWVDREVTVAVGPFWLTSSPQHNHDNDHKPPRKARKRI